MSLTGGREGGRKGPFQPFLPVFERGKRSCFDLLALVFWANGICLKTWCANSIQLAVLSIATFVLPHFQNGKPSTFWFSELGLFLEMAKCYFETQTTNSVFGIDLMAANGRKGRKRLNTSLPKSRTGGRKLWPVYCTSYVIDWR
jgi:hypothetical protein